ncbi:MAG: HNH endonuclease signature motif containing protein [Gemmataceae bacterium]
MDEATASAVRERARHVCEYYHLPASAHPAPFEIEHVVPKQHGGASALGNLAYSCLHCNKHKGPNLAGIDRVSSRTKLVRLFNPRRHTWRRHFRWEGPYLVGRTAIGRVTVQVLAMNDPVRVTLRQALLDEGVHLLEE